MGGGQSGKAMKEKEDKRETTRGGERKGERKGESLEEKGSGDNGEMGWWGLIVADEDAKRKGRLIN